MALAVHAGAKWEVIGLLRQGRAHAGEGGGLGAKEGKDGLVLVLC
jgi:hypothetical protein